jgi:hypothetical protein
LRWFNTFGTVLGVAGIESPAEMTLSISFWFHCLLQSNPGLQAKWWPRIKPTWSENLSALPLRFNTFDLSSNYIPPVRFFHFL